MINPNICLKNFHIFALRTTHLMDENGIFVSNLIEEHVSLELIKFAKLQSSSKFLSLDLLWHL